MAQLQKAKNFNAKTPRRQEKQNLFQKNEAKGRCNGIFSK